VPGLDAVLGGGLPEYSFNLIAGGPGSGKTTLAHQIMFANATVELPALYFTVLGEPTIKMLRYQRQFRFFDMNLAGSAIQFINLSAEVLAGDLAAVLQRIVTESERTKPGIVVVDSFRTIAGHDRSDDSASFDLDAFVQRLAHHLTTWEVTSFLLGEYATEEQRSPVFTVADGVLWLAQATDRNSVVRKLQVIKTRGRAPMPGLHTFRITDNGLQVFPRIPEQTHKRSLPSKRERLSIGVKGMDSMLDGGIIAGAAVMLTGPAGSGKSTVAAQFMSAGLANGETGVIAVFEEYPEEYLRRANARNPEVGKMIDAGKLVLIYLRPLDLSVDEALFAILEAVDRLGAKRVVIDSLSGFEVALAPTFREDFRESLYRLVGTLTATGVTVFMTAEVAEAFAEAKFTTEKVSFITDVIIVQRYVEMEGELRRVVAVVKMRGSNHSHEFRTYEVTSKGVVVGGALSEYDGILTGTPTLRPKAAGATKVKRGT
jgi:circadian clock protein KaiC